MRRFLTSLVAVALVLGLVGMAEAKGGGSKGGGSKGTSGKNSSSNKNFSNKNFSGKNVAKSNGKYKDKHHHRFSYRWFNGSFWCYYDGDTCQWLYYDDAEGDYVLYPANLTQPPAPDDDE
jgi:hypothetical protein